MEPNGIGMYTVKDKELIGKPETPRAFNVTFTIKINGTSIDFVRPVVYRYSQPDKGEIYQPFEVLPEVTASIENKVIIFADAQSKKIPVIIRAGKNNLEGYRSFKSS